LLGALVVLVCSISERTGAQPTQSERANTYVIDGDTLVINRIHYRLHGIDAPENSQSCDADSSYHAGSLATAHMRLLIGHQPVTCIEETHDRYGRTIARCGTPDIPDLGKAMVEDGMAWAYLRYSTDYADDERRARANHRGIHAHQCLVPWIWRREFK
jgi:endonuclease YncB( thermonuclease family)